MAEVTAFRNNALPYPVYGVPWTIVFPLLDADGDPVTGATCDSERSLNGDTGADCTNEGTEITFTTATNKGMYYLTLTAAEMTADIVAVTIYSATSKATAVVLYPRKLVQLATGTTQGGAAGYITLAAGTVVINNQYNGCLCVATIDTLVEARVLQVCTASNQQCTVTPGWNVVPDADDTYVIYLPEGMQMPTANVTAINNIAATSVTTVSANQGTTQPINFTGTGASAYAKSDVVDIAGAAVDTTAAQLGVNLVTVKTQAVTCAAGVTVLASVGTAATSTAQTGDCYPLVSTEVAEIYAAVITNATGADIAADIIAMQGNVTTIMADTDLLDDVSGGLADIHTDIGTLTTTVGAAGAGLTAIPWNATWDAEVQSEVDDALVAQRLDELLNADSDIDGITPPTVGSVFHELLTKTAGSFTYDQATDSLEALRDRGDAAWITATGFSTHSAADVWSVAARVLTAGTNIVLAKGVGVTGFNDVSAADVNAQCDTAISDAALATAVELAKVPKSDGTSTWNATALAAIQTECNDALIANNLDHLCLTATVGIDMTAEVADGTIISRIISNSDTSLYVPATSNLTTLGANVVTIDGIVDDILVDTAVIGALGAGLTAIPWNATWDAEVQSECDDAITANAVILDLPTTAEFNARTLPSADYTIVTDLGTVQTGDNYPLVSTEVAEIYAAVITNAAGVDIAADIIAVKADTAKIGTITNTGGTATIGAILGDVANIDIATRLTTVQADTDLLDDVSGGLADIHTDVGTAIANIADVPTVAEFNARTLPSADYVVVTDTIAGVTLCTTCTTNTDMRGTDNAALASVCTETRLAELDAANIPTDLSTIDTVVDAVKVMTDKIGTVTNTGGTATIGAILGDVTNSAIATRLTTIDTVVDAIKLKTDTLGGAGAITWTYTLTNSSTGAPIPNADVWVTSDLAGEIVIATGTTNASGVVTFYLDAAAAIYVWRQCDGYNFENPDVESVVG